MMTFRRAGIPGILALGCGLLLIACEDPSGVGLTAIDFGETDPRALIIPAETELDTLVDATGFVLQPGVPFTNRFLAGRVDDPLFGTSTVRGYVDFAQPADIPPEFFFAEVEDVLLSLNPTYVYGDTTGVAAYDVYEIADEWRPLRFRSDTTLAVHDRVLGTFSVAAADTLVRVQLDKHWVAENDSLIRSGGFNAQFHGFELRPRPESQMVIGFAGTSELLMLSQFQAVEGRDTTAYIASGIATAVERDLSTAMPPPELFPLQDSAGDGLYLDIDFEALGTQAISAGFIRVEADTLLLHTHKPPNFVRPIARSLTLFGIGDGPPTALAEAPLDRASESYTFASEQLSAVLQSMARDRGLFDRLAIGFPRGPSSLDAAPLVDRVDAPPRAVLLVVPADL